MRLIHGLIQPKEEDEPVRLIHGLIQPKVVWASSEGDAVTALSPGVSQGVVSAPGTRRRCRTGNRQPVCIHGPAEVGWTHESSSLLQAVHGKRLEHGCHIQA